MVHDFYAAGSGGTPQGYFDARLGITAIPVMPGQYYVSGNPAEMLTTLLGSCVTACIHDAEAGVGGINHFMLPESANGCWGGEEAALRFGNHAMSQLIAEILWRGGRLDRLEIKLFGGATITAGTQVGEDNVAFALRFLKDAGLSLAASHVGGALPRVIRYFPTTGRVLMRLLPDHEQGKPVQVDEDETWARRYAS